MRQDSVKFGFQEDWKAFHERHPEFLDKIDLLVNTLRAISNNHTEFGRSADKLVFALGHVCVEDFMEIILLCGNGYGIGGMKLLRGLFEHAVTRTYIAENPELAEQFLDYHDIHRGKLLSHTRQTGLMAGSPPADQIAAVGKACKSARTKYEETLCEHCGTARLQISWTKLDYLSMAREVGLERLHAGCYYEPMPQAHSTVTSLLARMTLKDGETVTFNTGPQREKADSTLTAAHAIILHTIEALNKYFNMVMNEEVQERHADF